MAALAGTLGLDFTNPITLAPLCIKPVKIKKLRAKLDPVPIILTIGFENKVYITIAVIVLLIIAFVLALFARV
jgi:hypothetical protein